MITTAESEAKTRPVDLTLRRATTADRAALIRMYEEFEPKGSSLGLPPLRDPNAWLERESSFPNFVALEGERAVGHSLLCPEGDAAEIAVFIHQDYRGRGLGKKLLAAMIVEARRLGLRIVWGVCDLDNVPMLRLARSLGFVSGKDPREFHMDLTKEVAAEEHAHAT